MAKSQFSVKHLEVSKANTMVVAVIAVAAFVTTFSLVASRSLLAKRSYQSKVITEKEKAVDQLRANIAAVDSLTNSYKSFVDRPENIIGGASAGEGDQDGDNAKIILDALPSKYDFPALATSIEKMLVSRNYSIDAINGTDDEVAQSTAVTSSNQAIEMPFQLSVNGNYTSMQELVRILERSIRPIQIESLRMTGNDGLLQMNIDAKTFYQPEKTLNITKKVVQ